MVDIYGDRELQLLVSWDLSNKGACKCMTALGLVPQKH